MPQAQGRDGDAAQPDEECGVHDAPVGLEGQEAHGDEDFTAPRTKLGTVTVTVAQQVRAELLAGDGHEHGPVARGETESHAEQVVGLCGHAPGDRVTSVITRVKPWNMSTVRIRLAIHWLMNPALRSPTARPR